MVSAPNPAASITARAASSSAVLVRRLRALAGSGIALRTTVDILHVACNIRKYSLRVVPGATMSIATGVDHPREFAAAWADPRNTRFELPPADINELLAGRYATGSPVAFTRDMLWDVEVRKAWRPDRYIPGVLRAGSARAWGRRREANGTESFIRSSWQRLWLQPGEYGLVLEQTHLDHQAQKVTLIGTAERIGSAHV